ncbi:MAG: dephospho-CoA kinase [Elusimicrobia bacterium]|nr:dephospho-CoA kinase [Elusimicrobiota bacterium]MDY6039717.1 dephospho-CoA kinase [Elusimicrobiaceae bacterium]
MTLRVKNKLVMGLTGGIASGKSTALAYFAKNGADTLSADELVRELYGTPAVQKRLAEWFGTYDAAEVAGRVFTDESARKKLEDFLHPLVYDMAVKRIHASQKPFVVFEVPLLFEAGWDKLTDMNVLVVGDPETLDARLASRGISREEYERRLAAQMPDSEKALRANVLFFNGGPKEDLALKVQRLCQALGYIYGFK